ncbi:MAG TPA: hypothetical protein VFB82_04330, partial [Blastocatellia bacterium]|nr:hypothetical protein [Blastocatellia bacterium]
MRTLLTTILLTASLALAGATFAGDDDKAKEKERQEQQEKAKAKSACTLQCASEKNDRDSKCPVGG